MSLPPSSSKPQISAIVLNYNGQQWLPRCFESLEAQTFFSKIETIVVDNNSPDGSAALAVPISMTATIPVAIRFIMPLRYFVALTSSAAFQVNSTN